MKSSRSCCFYWGPESSLRLYVRSCGEFQLVPPDRENWRTVDFGEIFWPISGQCSFHYHGQRTLLSPGHVWYYPPGAYHEYQPVSTFHYCWLTMAGEQAGRFFESLDISPGLNEAGPCPTHLFSILGQDFSFHTSSHRLNALNTAFRIVAQISIVHDSHVAPAPSIHDAKSLIDSMFNDPLLSVELIARRVRLHRGSLSRSFHKACGTSVSDYIIFVRLQHAMHLLRDFSLPVREIARSCGFHTANYFSKVFTAKIGMSPRRFRKQLSEPLLSADKIQDKKEKAE